MADLQDVLDDLKDLLKALPTMIADGVSGAGSLASAGVNAGVGLGGSAVQGVATGMERVGDFYIGIGKGLGQGVVGLTKAANEIAGLITDWDRAFRAAPAQVVGAAIGGIGQVLAPAVHGLGQVAGLGKDWAQAIAGAARPILRKGRLYGNRAGRRTFRNAHRHGLHRGAGLGAGVSRGVGFAGGIARGLGYNKLAKGLMGTAGPAGMAAAVGVELAGALKDAIPQVIAFAEGVNDSNRRLGQWNVKLAVGMRELAIGDYGRNLQLGAAVEQTAVGLAKSVNSMRDAFAGANAATANFTNRIAIAASETVGALGRGFLSPLGNAFDAWMGKLDPGGQNSASLGKTLGAMGAGMANQFIHPLDPNAFDAAFKKALQPGPAAPFDNSFVPSLMDISNWGPMRAPVAVP